MKVKREWERAGLSTVPQVQKTLDKIESKIALRPLMYLVYSFLLVGLITAFALTVSWPIFAATAVAIVVGLPVLLW